MKKQISQSLKIYQKSNFSLLLTKLQKKFSTSNNFAMKNDLPGPNKSGLSLILDEKPGTLLQIQEIFSKNNVNITYQTYKIKKFPNLKSKSLEIFLDFDGKTSDNNIKNALIELKSKITSSNPLIIDEIPWFPKTILDLNLIGRKVLTGGEQLSSDHPGFNDLTYLKRRDEIIQISNSYNMEHGENIPIVKYTPEENQVWNYLWNILIPLYKKHACEEVVENLNNFILNGILSENEVPQIKKISQYLKQQTNTIFRPVAGLLSQREFLNGLAFRVFHSTQYIRHKSKPLYTPEPDIVHETLGHAVLFANKDFADFSQEIGLASLSASDEDILKLASIYWFTIEFGLCLQNNQMKIYGAGILSSVSEIEWSLSSKPKYHKFDLDVLAVYPYSVTDIQENYFLAPSFLEMKKEVMRYVEDIKKPFKILYNYEKDCVEIDREICDVSKEMEVLEI